MKKLIVLFLTVVLLISSIPPIKAQAIQKSDAPKDMVKVAENDYLTLYLDEEETDIAVLEKSSGKIWYSNPVDVDTDEKASNYYKRVMKSQLQVQYYNESVQSSVMDNYNDAIMNGQFEIEKNDNGVTITYSLGAAVETLLLPEAISAERMEAYIQQMDDKAVKKINRNYTAVVWSEAKATDQKTYAEAYPGFEGMDFYLLRGGVKDYLKEELAGYFEEAGYTSEDLLADSIASGAADGENDKPWFQIPITYSIDGDNFVATVDPSKIEYNSEGYYLTDIDILPYFGAAREKQGYIFVPDGSGALIKLDNGKSNYSAYIEDVYGADRAKQVLYTVKPEIDENLTIKLPVFGIKAEDQAFIAIIEKGDGYADISADVSGRTGSYNHVNAGFSYLQYGPAALSDMVGSNTYQLYGPTQFEDVYQLRYGFLTGDKADYVGMASYYQQYLVENGKLTPMSEKTDTPFFTEYIGAVDKYKTVLGVKYKAVEALTNYSQAKDISLQLKAAGVENQNIVYTGWMNGGLHGTANTKINKLSKLEKNGVSLKGFLSDMQNNGIATYMTVDLQYVYQDKIFDGYTKLQYAPAYFDHSDINVLKFGIADGKKEGILAKLISPFYVSVVTNKIEKAFNKLSIDGINFGTASYELYSDFLEDRFTDRQKAIQIYQENFEALKQSVGATLGDNSNAYGLEYADKLINVPLSSNRYQIIDEDIPFYEIVMHGYKEYAGEALNMSDDYTTTLLKSVEAGAGLHFKWIYEDNSLLKETDYEDLYSVQYSSWIDTAIADYTRVNEVLKQVSDCTILKHERLDNNLVKITYSDSSVIYVNYSATKASVDGISVNAKDFALKKGSE